MSLMEQQVPAEDALTVLSLEIEQSKKERKPTSRHHLAEVVSAKTGMAFRDALDVVEHYCDTREPAIPEYLSGEFGIFWLKVVAIANAAFGLFLFYNGLGVWRSGGAAWPIWCLGTIFVGIGVFFWVRSLEAAADRH